MKPLESLEYRALLSVCQTWGEETPAQLDPYAQEIIALLSTAGQLHSNKCAVFRFIPDAKNGGEFGLVNHWYCFGKEGISAVDWVTPSLGNDTLARLSQDIQEFFANVPEEAPAPLQLTYPQQVKIVQDAFANTHFTTQQIDLIQMLSRTIALNPGSTKQCGQFERQPSGDFILESDDLFEALKAAGLLSSERFCLEKRPEGSYALTVVQCAVRGLSTA